MVLGKLSKEEMERIVTTLTDEQMECINAVLDDLVFGQIAVLASTAELSDADLREIRGTIRGVAEAEGHLEKFREQAMKVSDDDER